MNMEQARESLSSLSKCAPNLDSNCFTDCSNSKYATTAGAGAANQQIYFDQHMLSHVFLKNLIAHRKEPCGLALVIGAKASSRALDLCLPTISITSCFIRGVRVERETQERGVADDLGMSHLPIRWLHSHYITEIIHRPQKYEALRRWHT